MVSVVVGKIFRLAKIELLLSSNTEPLGITGSPFCDAEQHALCGGSGNYTGLHTFSVLPYQLGADRIQMEWYAFIIDEFRHLECKSMAAICNLPRTHSHHGVIVH